MGILSGRMLRFRDDRLCNISGEGISVEIFDASGSMVLKEEDCWAGTPLYGNMPNGRRPLASQEMQKLQAVTIRVKGRSSGATESLNWGSMDGDVEPALVAVAHGSIGHDESGTDDEGHDHL